MREIPFTPNYRLGQSARDYGFVSTTYTSKDFKDEVFKCLIKKFSTGISRGNKSLKIAGNTYRNPIDVVPCLRYRDYSHDFTNDQGNYVVEFTNFYVDFDIL